jgi:hypothetical protein
LPVQRETEEKEHRNRVALNRVVRITRRRKKNGRRTEVGRNLTGLSEKHEENKKRKNGRCT